VNSPDVHAPRPKSSKGICKVCGKPSEKTICDPCAMKIHLDALARKTHEEKGNAWAKWESPDSAHKRHH
jgi:predicted amidophosphoribosyltransferase